MRRVFALLLLVCAAVAQIPRISEIDFYGLRKVTPSALRSWAGVQPGGPLPPSRGALEDKIAEMSGVVEARVEAVCCDGDRAALFIGIEERGAPHTDFRSEPSGEATLPQDLMDHYQQFLTAVQRAAAHGNAGEDLTAGHSMMDDPAARAFQTEFVTFAADHLNILRDVLHNGSDPDQRAIAAAVIGYGPKTQQVADELQFALTDPEPAVRANAIRSLSAFIVYASKESPPKVNVPPTWFVELLHSVELRDRTESVRALTLMTDHNGQAALSLLRERALPDLAEMARWHYLRYALPPFLLLGRVAGLPEDEIQQRWAKGEREPVIQKALETGAAKARK